MKKRNLTTLTVVALLLVLLTLIAVSGTYAKYTTSVTGTAQAIVAKWAFKAEYGTNQAISDNFTINLVEASTETKGIVDGKIQPGSSGTLTITIDNSESDVAAKLNVTSSAITDGLNGTQFTVEDVTIEGTTDNVIEAGQTATAKVDWVWNYEVEEGTTDADDTLDGTNATEDAIDLIQLTITGTQVDPNATT